MIPMTDISKLRDVGLTDDEIGMLAGMSHNYLRVAIAGDCFGEGPRMRIAELARDIDTREKAAMALTDRALDGRPFGDVPVDLPRAVIMRMAAAGLSDPQVARIVGCSLHTIYRIRDPRTHRVQPKTFRKIVGTYDRAVGREGAARELLRGE